MDVNIFSEMLLGKDPAEAYIESNEGKKEITINSNLLAVMYILIEKKIISNEEFEKAQKKCEEIYKDKIRAAFKKLEE